jgi:hypothetical protein
MEKECCFLCGSSKIIATLDLSQYGESDYPGGFLTRFDFFPQFLNTYTNNVTSDIRRMKRF